MAAVWGSFDTLSIEINNGSVKLSNYGDCLFATYFGVEPEYRRKGTAKLIMRICKKVAKRRNLPIRLDASPFPLHGVKPPLDYENLVAFYKRMGFKEDETRPNRRGALVYEI